jgi:hypothetical protein
MRFVECSFLIPTVRDSDGTPHAALAWRLLMETLARQFGGWSGPERVMVFRGYELVPGGWIPEKGSRPIQDESRRFIVSIPEDQLEVLRAILRRSARTFDQQAIYLSVRGYVEFITPEPDDEFLE